MLEPQHNDSTSNGSGNNNKPSLSFKELKEQLKLNKIKTELAVDTPVSGSTSSLGTGTEPTSSSSPPQSQIFNLHQSKLMFHLHLQQQQHLRAYHHHHHQKLH